MKNPLLAAALALSCGTGCVLSSRLLGGSSSGARSGSEAADAPASSAGAAAGSRQESNQDAPPELQVKPLLRSYESYHAGDARALLAELEAAHTEPSKRTRSDDAILSSLHLYLNAMFMLSVDKTAAVEMWGKAKQLADLPPNSGPADELESKSFRQAAVALSDLHKWAHGQLGGAFDPGKTLDWLKDRVAAHEKEFLDGKTSQRARAFLASGNQIAGDHRGQFEQIAERTRNQKAYDEDPQRKKLEADWHDLNVEAGALAERLGEDEPSNWANSTHPSLEPYQKRLTDYQAKDRRLRKKHGLPE